MKIFFRIIAIFTIVVGFASCDKNNAIVNPDQNVTTSVRDIFYSVSQISGLPSFSGTTAHITTDSEWDALLDKFCDMTRDGEQVTFCNTNPSVRTKAKDSGSNTSTTITTQNREELKNWMKEMEKVGKTVNISFDDDTDTWHGVAYTNSNPQSEEAEQRTCTGALIITPVSIMEDSAPVSVLALQSSTEGIFIFTVHGMMLISETDEPSTLIDGYEVSITGLVSTFNDVNGDTFSTLELDVNEGDVITF